MTNVRAIIDQGLGNSSYLVEVAEGRALVVDPSRDPLPYLRAAAAWNLEIAWVAETHLHADFVSGARELVREGASPARRTGGGARLPAPPARGRRGDRSRRAAAPGAGHFGHTPEHLSYLLLDGSKPVGVFTGGALLPG